MCMTDETIIELISGLVAAQVDAHEIFISRGSSFVVGIKEGEIELFKDSDYLGVALRILQQRRPGFAYLGGFTEALARTMVADAIGVAQSATEDKAVSFPAPPATGYPEVAGFDATLADEPREVKVARAKTLESEALAVDPRIKKVRSAQYRESMFTVTLANSTGLRATQQGTAVSVSVTTLAADESGSEMGWDYQAERRADRLDPAGVARCAAQRALDSLGGRSLSSRKCPVIFTNQVVVEILGVLAASFRGDNVSKGKSLLKDRMGDLVFSPQLTIIDDGLYPGGVASAAFDDEGVPCRETRLVENGRLTSFLYDTYWATRAGGMSTGNANRGDFKTPPFVSVSNLYIKPGATAFDSLVSQMHEGLVVEELMGIHTADPISGDFSVGCSGYWVEGGTRSFPVRGAAISGNVIDLFGKIGVVGNDLRFYGHEGAPSLLIDEISLSGDGA
ncbi:MAG: TldD/PmbA family protein [Deltaproteobacteria bacterium]|nr:TldD/PmbA family protein [Deltaproteobacteria bacterium]